LNAQKSADESRDLTTKFRQNALTGHVTVAGDGSIGLSDDSATSRVPDLTAQRDAIKKLDFLLGKWAGEARLLRGAAEWVELL